MEGFKFYMPTNVLYGKDIIKEKGSLILGYGKKAFIVTGKGSSKRNGSLNDIVELLKENNISYSIFDEIEENPSLETVERAALKAGEESPDFIIGIGGGSPIDSAKGIGILIKNPEASVEDLFGNVQLESIPLIAVPTTAGTGSEVTPFAVFTDHKLKTKISFTQRVFPEVAFLDPKYHEFMPCSVTVNTAVDALSHLIEGYLCKNANVISDASAEKGFKLFGECINALRAGEFSYEIREKLLLASTLGGIVIAETGTSLPHAMGYSLTYFHGFSHGKANGILLKAYLEFCENAKKTKVILDSLCLKDLNEFGEFIEALMGKEEFVSEEEIIQYTKAVMSNKAKLETHPYKVSEEDILNIYKKSLF